MLWNWKPWFWDFFSSKCISIKEKNWRDVKNETLNGIWCCNIFSLGYTWEHKTQLNIPGKITYGNISFLLFQTQLAKNSSELKLTCFFFFSKCIFNYFLSKNPNFVLTVWVGRFSLLTITIYTHVSVRNVWYFFLNVIKSFQCLKNIPVPSTPYVIGVLIKRLESPWAQLFPLRLQLRLGAEFRCKWEFV